MVSDNPAGDGKIVNLFYSVFPSGITKVLWSRRLIFQNFNHKDGLLNLLFSFLSILLEFGIMVWLIPFGIM